MLNTRHLLYLQNNHLYNVYHDTDSWLVMHNFHQNIPICYLLESLGNAAQLRHSHLRHKNYLLQSYHNDNE